MAGASAHDSTDPCTDDGEHSGHPAVPDDAGAGIPVVDFDALVNGAPEQRAQAVRDVGRACQDWGFFMVVNHGVPEDLKAAVMEACEELFSSPEEEKAEYLSAGPMASVRVGSGFYAAVDGARYWRDYLKMFAHPELHWPAKPARLREVATEYAATTRRLLLTLATAVSESLGLAGGRVSEAMRLESCFQILVANRYPPCPYAAAGGPGDGGGDVGAAALGMPAHSDHGFLTLLFQNGVDGLQVQHGGRWLLATPLPRPRHVLRHRRRPAGDREQREVQGRSAPRGGRRRAREDVDGEHDLAVPGHRRRAGPGAGGGRAGLAVPGRQVQGLHGASAEQQAERESSAGHRPGAACHYGATELRLLLRLV